MKETLLLTINDTDDRKHFKKILSVGLLFIKNTDYLLRIGYDWYRGNPI